MSQHPPTKPPDPLTRLDMKSAKYEVTMHNDAGSPKPARAVDLTAEGDVEVCGVSRTRDRAIARTAWGQEVAAPPGVMQQLL